MKKLFTTLLLLGAVAGTQAQVTVTAFDAEKKTVTINYDRSQGLATEQMVGDAIKLAFEGDPGQGIAPTMVETKMEKPAIKAAVSTIKLTGDWENRDTNKDNGKTIKKIVDEFSDPQSRDTLDLSACKKFCSEFISVVDECNGEVMGTGVTCPGYQGDQFETYFTANYKLADETTTFSVTKTETPYHSVIVTVSRYSQGDINSDNLPAFIKNLEGEDVDYTATYSFDGGTIAYFEEGYQVQFPHDYDEGYDTWTVASEGWWWYSSQHNNVKLNVNRVVEDGVNATYTYTDEEDNTHELAENQVTDNGDGTYSYTIAVTHDDTPFAINKDYNLGGIIFPTGSHFTYIPDNLFKDDTKIKKAIFSEELLAIGNKAFGNCGALEEVNFPASLTEIGYAAFKKTGIKTAELAPCTGITRLRFELFQNTPNLATVTFPTNIIEIQKEFCQYSAITVADLSECHKLRVIAQFAFANCNALTDVRVCSHPKKIKGGEGAGAFNTSEAIRTVEVVGCKDAPNITQCICENNAFSPMITYVQTQVENVETLGARLIFPQDMFWDMPMKSGAQQYDNEYMGYASCFDFFVGDYKEGVAISKQSNVEAYFKFAPRGEHANAVDDLTGTSHDAFCASDEEMRSRNGIGNGWHEFMHVGEAIVIHDEADFLRTYSRTEGSGAVLLPPSLGITAYRAVDFISDGSEYIPNKLGNLVFIGDPTSATDLANPDNYLTKEECKEQGISIKGKPTYFYATVGGTLYLRPLRPLRVSNGEYVQGYSYIPENTGVVLYSKKLAQDVFLIMKPYTDTEFDLTSAKAQYPHTGMYRFEKERRAAGGELGVIYNNGLAINDPANLSDNINLLQGSYGKDTGVAPVSPWTYADPATYKGGNYDPAHIEYRNFGFNKSQNKWLRLQPGIMRYNRAYAMIPASRFDNNNESAGQMPDFTLDDMPVGTAGSSNTFVMIGSEFEDEMTDGIQTISTSTQSYDKDAWYTLQGVRVDNPTKGVYIHNNKKVVIK